MPLVFVHGVNVRRSARYAQAEETRNGLFRSIALAGVVSDPAGLVIENPHWGQYGATLAWNQASLPDQQFESFGSEEIVFDEILDETAGDIVAPSPDQALLTLARVSLARAVDCLWASAAFTDSGDPAGPALAALAPTALKYAEDNPRPGWLDTLQNDDQLVDRLMAELQASEKPPTVESFGVSDVWNHLKTTVVNLANRAARTVVNTPVRLARPWANSKAAFFIGDVFVYLKDRDQSGGGRIVNEVKAAFLRAANARRPGDDKLIVVAHSMGGNITYDILTSFASDVHVDLLLTVGSQVGLFEELKLFRNSDAALKAPALVPLPANIARWINVMDRSDILAYSTSRIFRGALDTNIDNQAPAWSAHSAYFYRPAFHQRLAARVQEQP